VYSAKSSFSGSDIDPRGIFWRLSFITFVFIIFWFRSFRGSPHRLRAVCGWKACSKKLNRIHLSVESNISVSVSSSCHQPRLPDRTYLYPSDIVRDIVRQGTSLFQDHFNSPSVPSRWTLMKSFPPRARNDLVLQDQKERLYTISSNANGSPSMGVLT
jgi:hypothetical protein